MSERLQTAAVAGWPPVTADTVFDYGFTVWPDETSPRMRGNAAVFPLFRHILTRSVMQFTERGFDDFREELARWG